jgi:TRAP transporter TAXI family solute receptor
MLSKKGILFLSVFILFSSMVMFSNVNPAAAADPVRITVVGGSVGGSWSVFTEGAVEAMRKGNPDYQISAEPGSTTANPGMVNSGKAEMGLAFGLTSLQAVKGEGDFKTPLSKLRAVCALIPNNAFQFIIRENAGITSFEQIKAKKFPLKVSVDSKGSTGDLLTSAVLNAYGITYADIEKWGGKIFYLSSGKTNEMMADNRMDGTGDCLSIPAGDIIEASTSIKLKMLPINDAAIKKVGAKYGMTKVVVPKGTYTFLDKDIPTINMPVILLVNADMPDDVVYNLAKSLHNNVAYLKNVAKGYAALNDKTIVVVNNVPFHPGAAKYFKEAKLLK